MVLTVGCRIRLFAISAYARTPNEKKGGFVGVYTRRGLIGLGNASDTQFQTSIFSIYRPSEPNQQKRNKNSINENNRIRYGESIVLVDQDNLVWNSRTPGTYFSGYMAPSKHCSELMDTQIRIKFLAPGRNTKLVCLGDRGVSIKIVRGKLITNFKKPTCNLSGGYLCSDGSGLVISFCIVGPTINLSNKTCLNNASDVEKIQKKQLFSKIPNRINVYSLPRCDSIVDSISFRSCRGLSWCV